MFNTIQLYNLIVQQLRTATSMKNVSISELRANLLKYLTVVQHGEPITVTSKGQVLATLTPPVGQQDAARKRLAELAETAVIGDVISPTEERWDATR